MSKNGKNLDNTKKKNKQKRKISNYIYREKSNNIKEEKSNIEVAEFPPTTLMCPVPVVMVSVGNFDEANIITIGWTGIVNSKPPMTYISVRKQRHSYKLIKKYKNFYINMVDRNLIKSCDWCGVKSGRDFDKWNEMKLEKIEGNKISSPSIKLAPVALECEVKEEIELGSHIMFLAEIIGTRVRKDLVDNKNKISPELTDIVAYMHGHYHPLGRKPLGKFGFSVMKKSTKRKLNNKNNL